MMLDLYGIVPSLNTPFQADGSVDEPAMRALVEETIAAGCTGLLAIAVAGEQSELTIDEKDRITRIITETNSDRISTFISVTSGDPDESRALSAMARDAGASGICCQVPTDLAVLPSIADIGPDILMLQDLDWIGDGLPLGTIADLHRTLPTFRSLKVETVNPGKKYSEILRTLPDLHVGGGWAVSTLPDAFDRGVHAFMPTAMDRIYVAIYQALRSRNPARGQALFDRLLPVLNFSNQHINISIRFFKMMRHREGLFSTDHCRTRLSMSSSQHTEAIDHIVYVETLRSELAP